MKKIEMIGRQFHRLKVVSESQERRKPFIHYLCECECGNTLVVGGGYLRNGHTKSCGCMRDEIAASNSFRHGHVGTPTYSVWEGIKRRCLCKNDRTYQAYGAKGISICDEWRNDFLSFLRDMGERPANHEIDRIDGSKGYEPTNCRWVTKKENNRNKARNIRIEFNGETRLLVEWADAFGVSPRLLHDRHRSGDCVDRMFRGLTLNIEKEGVSK